MKKAEEEAAAQAQAELVEAGRQARAARNEAAAAKERAAARPV